MWGLCGIVSYISCDAIDDLERWFIEYFTYE